jgi:4-hydroxy-3-polyprenylbenzoate decarboxylase
MPYENLPDFLSELQDDGELRRISVEVDPVLEVAAITDRVCKAPGGGPALLFERVRGTRLPLVVNLLGSSQRICRALGVKSWDEITERIPRLMKPEAPESLLQKLKLLPQAAASSAWPPQLIKTGLCQQVVKLGRDINLHDLPSLQSWPGDCGRFLSGGQVHCRHPETAARCVEQFPLEIRDRNTVSVYWNRHHQSYRIFLEHRARGTQMPLALVYGGDPVLTYLPHAPLPPNLDPLIFAGFLRGKGIDLVKCRQIELEVPAHAELIFEGYLDPTEPAEPGGPYGQSTGFYSPAEEVATWHVTAITHRGNPVMQASVAGRPPMEAFWIEEANQRLLLPLIQLYAPEVAGLHFPRSGAGRNVCFVSIHKTYPQQARKVMHALWSMERTMFSKFVVVVDADVDVRDEEQVWFHAGAHVHPGRDTVLTEGPADLADHAAPVRGVGRKLGLDATRKLPEEGHPRPWPDELRMTREVQDLIARRWSEYRLDSLTGEGRS